MHANSTVKGVIVQMGSFTVLVVFLVFCAVLVPVAHFWETHRHPDHYPRVTFCESDCDATCRRAERVRDAHLRTSSDVSGDPCENLAGVDGETAPT
jgi:hypothetical protein